VLQIKEAKELRTNITAKSNVESQRSTIRKIHTRLAILVTHMVERMDICCFTLMFSLFHENKEGSLTLIFARVSRDLNGWQNAQVVFAHSRSTSNFLLTRQPCNYCQPVSSSWRRLCNLRDALWPQISLVLCFYFIFTRFTL